MNKTSLEDKMTTAAERKYINIRKRLDQLGYRQTLTVECLPLVEKLFSDLVHTTESLRKSKLSAVKAEKESANFDFVLEPYKLENARLSKENNELYLELMKLREQSGQHIKELKTTLKKCARETADLKFLNNQYVHKLKLLEKESKAKNEKIQQLQEKNLQAVVQTPGGKKRSIAFRRQRMQIDEPVPPSEVSSYPVPQPDDPIQELQQEVYQLQEKLAVMESGLRDYNKQIELREREIERLSVALDGGRSPDILSLETRNKANEKLIAHLNIQELNLCHKEKERLSDELLIKSDLETVVHQLEQEKQRLNKKIESFAVTEKELTLEVERMRLEHGIKRRDKSPSRLDTFLKGIEDERDFYKKELERLQHLIQRRSCSRSHSTCEKIPVFKTLEKGDYNSEIHLITRERDELQHMLERFEKHMEDIQSNVKLLTAERDKLSVLYNEHLHEMSVFEKSELEKTVEHLTCVNHQLENEKCELKSKMLKMKETIEALEKKVKLQAQKLSHVAGDSSHQKTEMNSLRLVNEQLQRSLEDSQHQLAMKRSELESAQAQVKILEEKIGKLHLKMTSQNEEAHVMKKTIGVIDKEKDILQETVDEKTEKIANLHENLANKEKAITQMKITVSEYESSMKVSNEYNCSPLTIVVFVARNPEAGSMVFSMAEIGQISLELEAAVQEKEEMKSRVHNYITEVSRWESLMAAKERENQDLLDRFQMLHDRAEDWEVKAHQAEGESSSVRLELLSIDTERRHLRERVELLEKEIQEVAVELENVKSESELLKKQLSSERHTIKNLESLLATNRDKEFHSHLTSHEKDTEIQLLKEKLTFSESKLGGTRGSERVDFRKIPKFEE
eukprot:bmy_09822T0